MALCAYDAAMATFQKGCKAEPSHRALREAWFGAKNVAKTFRAAARLKLGGEGARAAAFEAARQPALHSLRALPEAADRATAYENLAAIHTRWGRHAEACGTRTRPPAARPLPLCQPPPFVHSAPPPPSRLHQPSRDLP